MQRDDRRRFDMFVRVRDFGMARRDRFPESSPAGQSFAVVAAAVAQLDAQNEHRAVLTRQDTGQKAEVRRAILAQMTAIVRTARTVALTRPGAASPFELPRGRSNVAVLAAARVFIRESQAVKDTMVQHGLPDTFISDLQAKVDAFEQASKGRDTGRAGLAMVRAGTKKAVNDGAVAARALDVIVGNMLAGEPEQLAAWKSARRVEKSARSTTSPAPAAFSTTAPPVVQSVEPLAKAS